MNYLKHKSRITTSCFLIVNHNVDTLGWVTVFPLHRRGVEGLPGGLDARPSPSWFIIILYFILILYLLTPHPNPKPFVHPTPCFPIKPPVHFSVPPVHFSVPPVRFADSWTGGVLMYGSLYICFDFMHSADLFSLMHLSIFVKLINAFLLLRYCCELWEILWWWWQSLMGKSIVTTINRLFSSFRAAESSFVFIENTIQKPLVPQPYRFVPPLTLTGIDSPLFPISSITQWVEYTSCSDR